MKLTNLLLLLCCFIMVSVQVYADDEHLVNIQAENINYGRYDPTSVNPTHTIATIDLTFYDDDDDDSPVVRLDAGLHSGGIGEFFPRKMKSQINNNTLDYNLYIDSACTKVWGDSNDNNTFTLNANINEKILTVYGRIPALQNVSVGSYSDRVTITVEW